METQSVDPREAFVKEITDESDVSNCTSSDYEKIEDAFLAAASEMDKYLEQCEALRAAGFVELAVSLVSLDNHRQAYDWARETVIPHLIFDLKNLTAIGHSDLLLSFAGNSSWPLPLSLSVTSTT
ncbi:hypothetical protein ACRN98_19410, partial [Shewanella oncorhynchi]|uniref:hypothetical protein n=2 Tax=Shewanellaceae TaxID=267890 RepID=UPI003D7BD416